MSSVSQAASTYLIALVFSLFIHAFRKILPLLREEWVKKFYEPSLKNEETDIEAVICKNKFGLLCIVNTLLGNHKAMTKLSLKLPPTCEFGLRRNHILFTPLTR